MNGVPQSYAYLKNGSNPLNGQRLSSDGINAYAYNANGNTLTRNGSPGSFTFGWDADDRMSSISGAATASYVYDYQGRRTSKTVSGATTSYLYDGLNLVHEAGASAVDVLFGPGIDEPLATVQAGNVSYFSVDGLGSVNLLTDPTGAVQNAYLYDAWGVVKSQAGTLANDFGYTAREFGEANLWYYRARYYQAGVGRFGQEDSIWRARGGGQVLLRLFRYVRNPTQLSDPMGLWDLEPSCKCKPFAPPPGAVGPGFPNMENDVKTACGYLDNPQCSRFLKANFPPIVPDCMARRCHPDDKTPIRCDPHKSEWCGWHPPGLSGGIVIYPGNDTCPERWGFGFAPTIFHEAMHSCHIMTEPYETNQYGPPDENFRNAERLCTGWPHT